MRPILLLSGPPYSGKGTYANVLSKIYRKPHLSCGDLVKDKLTNNIEWFGDEYTQEEHDKGILVPDSLIINLMNEEIEKQKPCILEGYPRTIDQTYDFVKKYAGKFNFILLKQSRVVLFDRAKNRMVCPQCKKIYCLSNPNMLPINGNCTVCETPVIQRSDDKPETVRRRLDNYFLVDRFEMDYTLKNASGRTITVDTGQNNDVAGIAEYLHILIEDAPFNRYDIEINL